MAEQRRTILQNAMVQLCIFIFSLLIVFLLVNYQPSSSVTDGGVGTGLSYLFSTTPIILIILGVLVDVIINLCLYVLLKKWHELPQNRRAYEKEMTRQREKESAKKVVDNKFEQLRAKAEQGKKLTQEEEKWLKNYMGPIWYASLKRKINNKDD
jgi:uncharacterized membrane protein (DUF106 family)